MKNTIIENINKLKSGVVNKKPIKQIRNIIPINQRIHQVDNTHKTIISILNQIEKNIVQSRRHKPWKEPRWKSAKITAQHIEEIGLLSRLNKIDQIEATKEALDLINELLDYYQKENLEKEIGDYYELFLSETAIALIYASEYFAEFLTEKQKQYLIDKLIYISDALWELILNSKVYEERTQNRLAWNHSLFVHAVSGICSIKLNNEQSDERLGRAILWIEGYLSHSFTWEGFSREGIFYAGATRAPLLLFLMALKEYKSIDLSHHAALLNHHQYLINEWVPNSSKFISRNDINHLSYSTTLSSLLIYAHLYQCDKTLTLWETIAGEKGDKTFGNPSAGSNRNGSLVLNYLYYPSNLTPSEPLGSYVDLFKVYREVGVVVGFSKKLAFKYSFQASTHISEIHSQSDHGQIYLYLNGDTLLSDTSVGNNRHPDTPGQSEGHNSLMIDGKGMSLSGCGWQTSSILEDASCQGGYHVIRANLTPAYNAFHSRTTLASYKRLVIVHMKEPYYIVVLDSVSDYKSVEHEYAYRFHTDTQNNISHDKDGILIEAPHSKLHIVPLGLNWQPQEQESFTFNKAIRSVYIDSLFTGKEFTGGYILIPSLKQSTVNITKSDEQITIETSAIKSNVRLSTREKNLDKYVVCCETINKQTGTNLEKVALTKDTCSEVDSIDCLSGHIISVVSTS